MPTQVEFMGTPDTKTFHQPKNEPPKFKRFVGVEIEVAATNPVTQDPVVVCEMQGCTDHPTVKNRFQNQELLKLRELVIDKWFGAIGYDASLPKWGFEIQTAPAIGADFARQIREICTMLKELRATITPKCGTHIHVDLRDYTFDEIYKLMVLYQKFEEEWLRTQSPARIGGKYCRPCGPKLIEGLEQVMNAVVEPAKGTALQNKWMSSTKYKAVNFLAYNKHKTVEVRMHEGTLDAEEIIHWSRCWSVFVQRARDLSLKQINKTSTGLTSLVRLLDTESARYLCERTDKYKNLWTPQARGLAWAS